MKSKLRQVINTYKVLERPVQIFSKQHHRISHPDLIPAFRTVHSKTTLTCSTMQTTALAALLASGALAAPASWALEQRQDSFSYFSQCDALRQPTWDDCKSLISCTDWEQYIKTDLRGPGQPLYDSLTATAGGDGNYLYSPRKCSHIDFPPSTCYSRRLNAMLMQPINLAPPPAQRYVLSNGNCVLSYGWNDRSYEFRQFNLVQAVDTLQSQCRTFGAGGVASLNQAGGPIFVSIYSESSPPAGSSVQTIQASEGEVASSKKTKRENTSWTTAFSIENSTPDQFRQQVLDALPGGSTWSLTTESSFTSSIESTTELSADLLSLFTATQTISVGYEETLSYSTTQEIPNNCGNDQTG